jgi:serine/threonine protein kinase
VSLRPPKPSTLIPGYRLDRYELLCPIAQGGMASVWVARQLGKHGFEKLVAVKTILPEFAEDSRFQKMFLDEAHIASGIEHANVAQILDLGEEHGVLYLVMELVDGDALSKLHRALEKKNLAIPLGVTLRILADTCGGLHAAHELRDKSGALLGVVHRDISPQNVLISTRGNAKLIDFGVAKARDRLGGETNAGVLKGKVNYMAPEQAIGKAMDRRADVWAIGAILYHLLSGRPPFDGPNQLAALHRLTSGKPPLPLPTTVPRAVNALVLRALAQDPEKRIATAYDMQIALEDAMAECKSFATSADVASFVREHLGDRADVRRKAIEVALAAAADRVRIHDALRIDVDASSSMSGFTDIPKRLAALDAVRTSPPPTEPPTAPGLPFHKRVDGSSASGTMASTTLEPLPARKQRAIVIVASVSALAALLLVFALGRKSASTAAERPVAIEVVPKPIATYTAASTAPPVVSVEPTPPAVVASAPASTTAKKLVVAKPPPPKPTVAAPVKPKKKIDDGF